MPIDAKEVKWDDINPDEVSWDGGGGSEPKAEPLSLVRRIAMGTFHPSIAAAQLIGKGLEKAGIPYGTEIQDYWKEKLQKEQAGRAASGSTGFDWAGLAGELLSPESVATIGLSAPATLAGKAAQGAGIGATFGALTPQEQGVDLSGKAKQIAGGALGGGVLAPVAHGLSRVISPEASVDPTIQALREKGVDPTLGQALGGAFNSAEQRLTSIPIFGDAIRNARNKSINQFNNAVINEATAPIGVKVEGSGHEAVKAAGDALSDAYDAALGKINGVMFDPDFVGKLNELKQGTENLLPDMKKRFDKILSDNFGSRVSESGGMLPETYKKLDSELGQLSSRYSKSPIAAESELGDAVRQLQSLLREQVARSNPHVSDEIRAADEGWAKLVRIEKAAAQSAKNDGVFSPSQLMNAVKSSDRSARKRAVSRGDALLQDVASQGQVLGQTVPDSGTTERALQAILGGGFGAALMSHPVSALAGISGLGAGAAAYSPAGQRALIKAITERPEYAPLIARRLEEAASPYAGSVTARIGANE